MLAGAVTQASAYTLVHFSIGRVVSGLGMGFVNTAAPILQAEMSRATSRGRMFCVQLSTLNFGIMLAYWVDFAFSRIHASDSSFAWRVPVALQCVFILTIALLALIVPESPRWLVAHGREAEAGQVLARLFATSEGDPHVDTLLTEIADAVAAEQSDAAWKLIIGPDDALHTRMRFVVACLVQGFQQLGMVNGLIYYAGTILQKAARLSNADANLVSGLLFTWFFAASFIPHVLIDRLGRRKLLLIGYAVMSAIFAIEAGLIREIEAGGASRAVGIASTAFLFAYLGTFTVTAQATTWVLPSELLTLRTRGLGSGVSTFANWIINFIVVEATPPAIQSIGWRYYLIACSLNAAFVPILWLLLPETGGLELEAVDAMFAVPHRTVETGRLRAKYEQHRLQDSASSGKKGDQRSTSSLEGGLEVPRA